jgi:hypothetical protein
MAKKASLVLTDAERKFAVSKASAARFIVLPVRFVKRLVDIVSQPIEDYHAVRSPEDLAACGKTPCSPFDKLRANGGSAENQGFIPFVVSLSNHKSSYSAVC